MNNPVIYIKSAQDQRLKQFLIEFGHSIPNSVISESTQWQEDSSLDIFFGSWKDRNVEHHNLKRDIVSKSKNFIVLETALIGRKKVENIPTDEYVRLGLNGFLANTGKFWDSNCPPDRWEVISKDLNLDLEVCDRPKDGYILVALQLPGDASLQGTDINKWALKTVEEIRKVTDRDILIRTPQLQRRYDEKITNQIKNYKNIFYQAGTKENLIGSIKNAWCSVTYSSGLGIDSLLYGCPVIAYSPASFCYELCPNNVENIENITLPVRKQLFYNLSYGQWHIDELRSGAAWNWIKSLIE